ncbi:MAG: site-specific DNA-methyltransferase, partial [Bacteroidetes bacterium]
MIWNDNPKIEIYNEDCLPAMRKMKDNQFDLAIVDPPYGLEAKGQLSRLNGAGKLKNRAINQLSTEFDKNPPKEEYFNELFRVSQNQIIWGGNYFVLPPTRGIAIWDKEQPFPNFSAFEYAWTSFDKPAKIFKLATTRTGEKKIHPTQKPVALYKW